MKLGFSLFHAAAFMPTLLFLAAGWLLLISPFEFSAKVGLWVGTYLAAVVWTSTQTVRPDLTLALAWIAGLIALEAGRLSNWDPKRLFAGSLLLGYAAALHYPGAFGWMGILVYVVWVCRSLPWREARARVSVMLAGIALIGIPYLLLFLIPFRHEIAEILHQVQGEGGPAVAFRRHIEAYKLYSSLRPVFAGNQPLVQALLTPLWSWHVPAAFVGPPLLLAFRSTRGLGLAALPQLLFIVFGARHKDTRFSGYFTPEMIVYLCGVITSLAAAALWLTARFPSRAVQMILVTLGLVGLTGLTLRDKPSISGPLVRLTPNLHDMDLGRAAAREIAGGGAFMGSTSLGVWYTGGAADFYLVHRRCFTAPGLPSTREIISRDSMAWSSINSIVG